MLTLKGGDYLLIDRSKASYYETFKHAKHGKEIPIDVGRVIRPLSPTYYLVEWFLGGINRISVLCTSYGTLLVEISEEDFFDIKDMLLNGDTIIDIIKLL